MERVAFLVEGDGRRIDALLNPESLRLKRQTGIARRIGRSRPVTGADQRDDPLLFTGGGVTELWLDLLFDLQLAPAARQVDDVRDLSGPLWDLSENQSSEAGHRRPPLVRFVWGKSWNMPGVVLAVAERLERFTSAGAPTRSWLSLRLRRLAPPDHRHVDPEARDAAHANEARAVLDRMTEFEPSPGSSDTRHQTVGEHSRLDEVAAHHYGNPALWRVLARYNGIEDPSAVPPDTVLRIPPRTALRRFE